MTAQDFADIVFDAAKNSRFYDVSDVDYVIFQIHAAAYTYASLNHSGQNSDLYKILSTSEFSPGPMWMEDDEIESNEFYSLVEDIANRENIS